RHSEHGEMSSAQIVSSQADVKTRTRHFILLMSSWSLVVSLVARGYVLVEAPLPPVHPFPWLLGAFAEDIAILGGLAILALLLPRFHVTQLAARGLFGI